MADAHMQSYQLQPGSWENRAAIQQPSRVELDVLLTNSGGASAAVGDEVAGRAAERGRPRQVAHEPDQAQQRERLCRALLQCPHLAESAAPRLVSRYTTSFADITIGRRREAIHVDDRLNLTRQR